MIGRERDLIELGSRASTYMLVENTLPLASRAAAISYRCYYSVAVVSCVR